MSDGGAKPLNPVVAEAHEVDTFREHLWENNACGMSVANHTLGQILPRRCS
jgi:hypothetical protein